MSAKRDSDHLALAFYEVRLTYAQLNARACRLANALGSLGVAKGDRIAALLHNSPQFIETYFAAAKIGAIFVPLNFRLASAEMGRLLENCDAAVLIYGDEFSETIAPLAGAPSLPRQRVRVSELTAAAVALGPTLDYERWIGAFSDSEPDVDVAPGDDQLIVYTSGTTGAPKGAILSHRNTLFSSLTKIIDFGLTPSDTIVVFGPLFHVGPLMDLAIPTLQRGGRVVLGRSRGFDPEHLVAVLEKERATVVSIYPVMWRRVLALSDLDRYDLSTLRLLLTGGEPMPVPLLRAIYERFPIPFVNTYGSTEGGPVTTFLAPEHRFEKIGSIGKPAFGVQVKIVDERDEEVEPGIVGEIAVRSPFVCEGYWRRPDITAAARRNGWWHTGDLAKTDRDGFLWVTGRKTDMIISGAENIYPVEIETVISTLDGVVEVAVVGEPDPLWGETVVAFVVRRSRSDVDEARILEHCRTSLASYKKPRRVVFVEELPRTTNGKVSKEQLRQRLRED
jgi:acyl-CoA synthetase (AMP-forming)/AMP-acid ligase II